jgi:hypothetical protein
MIDNPKRHNYLCHSRVGGNPSSHDDYLSKINFSVKTFLLFLFWIPVFTGMTEWGHGMTKETGMTKKRWIPAFAGMTKEKLE